MPFVVGLAEYLWKRPADIFLFVIKFVIFMTKFIKRSGPSILRRCIFYAGCLLCFIEAHIVPKRQIKKVYLSVFVTATKSSSKTIFCILKRNFLRPPVYPEDLILFWNTFWYQHLFWAGVWEAFIFRLWIQAFLLHKSEIWALIPWKIYFFIFIFVNIR